VNGGWESGRLTSSALLGVGWAWELGAWRVAMGGGEDVLGQAQVLPEVDDALRSQIEVVVAPGELLLHIATGGETLQC